MAAESLSGCAGCEISFLNTGERFLGLLERLEIVHMPLLMDHKYFGPDGGIEIPRADIGFISGSIRNEEQLRIAEAMRGRCDTIVAFGTCAVYGGIPALGNLFDDTDIFRRCYRSAETTDAAPNPDQIVPPFLERTFALDEIIPVDARIPGCPPHPDGIAAALEALIEGRLPVLSGRSVCDLCPMKRKGKGSVQRIRRFVRTNRFSPVGPLGESRCLLEQGFLCLGPVTRAGCSGAGQGPPRCIEARVPCRGCHGPVREGGNQLLDILNALASNGLDVRSLPDRLSILRFSGAHGRLTRQGQKPA